MGLPASSYGHHGGVNWDSVWRRGRLWSAVRIGAPAGAFVGLIQFAQSGSADRALRGGIFFGLFFGAAMALVVWRSWPGAKDLSSADRVAVQRIVRRGEKIEEARLAPAVLEYAGVVRRTQEREDRRRWVLWVFAGATVIVALAVTIRGTAREEVVWWALVALWAGLLLWLPRRQARLQSHASHAEDEAHRLVRRDLDTSEPT
jgi:hypothetical protein